jgi:acetyltransferase-like isoleucine patch superfamily enzyme
VSKTKYNIAGINHPVILATLSKDAIIKLGYVGLSGATLCSSTMIEIKDYSGIGANSKLYDTDFHIIDPEGRKRNVGEVKSSPIIIDENVWIASDVTILKGVHIGIGSVVGAGSVVTKSIPPFELYAGNPAKKIRSLL